MEHFGLHWAGKLDSQKLACQLQNETNSMTLQPCREESENFDDTDNIFIEGDNLEVLKLIRHSYLGKVKMIYIDPPYNTGNRGLYRDRFTHDEWLSMMYPRLMLGRDLLRDDGVIFISIDDHEQHHLRCICDQIFGEENYETIIWNKEAEGKSGTLKQVLRFRTAHEYVVVLYKNKNLVSFNRIVEKHEQENIRFQTTNLAVNNQNVREGHKNWMKITAPNGKIWHKHWKFNNSKIKDFLSKDLIYWGKDGSKQPRLILPMDDRRQVAMTSIVCKGSTTVGRKDLDCLMGIVGLFSYPKPVSLISTLISVATNKNDIILDFFAGSATTAHAVMQQNAEDGGNRKYIMVELDEPLSEKSEAFKAGYKTIADIAKERIRRAAKKIITEYPLNTELDLGFKVFKVSR